MANEQPAGASLPTDAISLLERVTHFPTVLLILSFLLALDSGVSLGYRSTLLFLSWDFFQQHVTIGHILLFFLLFGLCMTIGVGLVRYLADQLAWYTVVRLWNKLFPSDDKGHPPYFGAVRPYKLREAAHVEQNKFYLDLYTEHMVLRGKKTNEEWRVASTAFACLFLGGINYLILPWLGYPSLSHQLASDFSVAWEWVMIIFSVLLSACWLYPMLYDGWETDWVYCLSLYRKLDEEQRKAKEQSLHYQRT